MNNFEINFAKNRKLVFFSISFILLVLSFFSLYEFSLLPDINTGARFTGDALTAYAELIEHGIVSDWHSEILIIIGIYLRYTLGIIFGKYPSGVTIIYIFYITSTILIISNSLLWIYRLYNHGAKFLISLVLFLFFYVLNCRMTFTGLDYFACAPLFTALSLSLYLRISKNLHKTIFLTIPLLISLMIFVSFRRNGILLTPLILFYSYPSLSKAIKSKTNKIILLIVSSLMIYILPSFILNLSTSVVHEHPTAPMMASDIMIASILRGAISQETCKTMQKLHSNGEIHSLNYYPPFNRHTLQTNINRTQEDTDILKEEWEVLRDDYISTWKLYPKHMLGAKILQMVYFYTGGYLLPCVRETYDVIYPEAKQINERWEFCRSITPYRHYCIIVSFFIGILCAGCTIILLVVYLPSCFKSRDEILYMLLTAMLYSLSYLIVTPTPSVRYITAPLFINSVYIIAGLLLFFQKKQYIKSQMDRKQETS